MGFIVLLNHNINEKEYSMDYWEMRSILAKIVPRKKVLINQTIGEGLVKEKGRKKNYHEYSILQNRWNKKERLLDKDHINSFVEISIRAPECPMPLNVDVWDGLVCPYNCRYCFANYFRASLYTSFFDNSREIGMRHGSVKEISKKIQGYIAGKGDPSLVKAFKKRIPVRFGIRFEDFLPIERKEKVSYELLSLLHDMRYPVMINTKSPLVAEDAYLNLLANNPAGSAVHMTVLTANETLSKLLDNNSPSAEARFQTAKRLAEAGVRVVMRIEPFGIFLNDGKQAVDDYIGKMKDYGLKHLTFDTYSYSAGGAGTGKAFEAVGIDFHRMFALTSESQWLGSLMLNRFMDYFRSQGMSASTFDFGSIPDNSNNICCEVDTAFYGMAGWNEGNILTAARYVISQAPKKVSWTQFDHYVEEKGGWLSTELQLRVHKYWNMDHDSPYNLSWVRGFKEFGLNAQGDNLWGFDKTWDFREDLFNGLIQ